MCMKSIIPKKKFWDGELLKTLTNLHIYRKNGSAKDADAAVCAPVSWATETVARPVQSTFSQCAVLP
jgi:hypothetical protein